MKILTAPPRLSAGMREFLSRNRKEQKHARDALRVRQDARGYIELDESGNVVNCYLQPEGKLPVIAVVAELEFGLGVVLEIGLNRTTPYRASESSGSTRSSARERTPSRERARPVSRAELHAAYPVIETMLERLVVFQRDSWTHKGEWWGKGLSKPVYRGIGIRVDKRDTPLYRQMLLEDIRLRSRYLNKLTGGISFWLRRFKYVSGYSEKFLRSNAGAGKVANALSYQRDIPLHLVVAARRSLGAFSGSRSWTLCESIMEAYRVKRVDDDACREFYSFLYGKERLTLPLFSKMRVRLEMEPEGLSLRGNPRHGVGCLTLEVIPLAELANESSGDEYDIPF